MSIGLIRWQPSAEQYTAVDPRYVGSSLEAQLYKHAAVFLEQASAIPEALHSLRAIYDGRPDDSAGLIECHRGTEAIGARIAQILGGCQEELLVCQPGSARRAERVGEASERDLAALRRGVRMRTLYHQLERANPGMADRVEILMGLGAEFRTLDEEFARVIIVDRKIAVVPGDEILTDSSETVAYIVNDQGIAGFLARQFEQNWHRALDWSDTGLPDLKLTGRQLAILKGLEAGVSQRVLSRQLGIGQRTMADAVAALRELFGAETTFQLACRWKELEFQLSVSR
jgi:sugar-specific transcriptional regulator TrmB